MTGMALLIVMTGLTLGPFGRLALTHPITPNLLVVFLWAVAWFRPSSEAIRLAIIGGLIIDLAGFSFFGVWIATAVAIVLIINALKSRFLDTSSLLHSMIALTIVSFVPLIIISITTRSLVYQSILLAVLGNVILGAVVYYLLAMRFKLFQRWAGRRLQ